jgi:tellurite resistance protein TerC
MLYATPLFVSLLFVEATDIIFAVDSVPAIYALTDESLIVFTSNVFAILGLRAMYFMLAGAVDKFHLIKYGLSVVLIFVRLKMVWLNPWYGGKFPHRILPGFYQRRDRRPRHPLLPVPEAADRGGGASGRHGQSS